MQQLIVDKTALMLAYRQLKDGIGKLELLLAEIGCPHFDAVDVTTMGNGVVKHWCPDCNEYIEEDADHGEV